MSKGKATRSSTATSSTPAPAPTISNDILTGRFTENEWNALVEVEDGEDFVFDLVETVVNGVLGVIHERHMDQNMIPYSLDWAEQIMVDLIDWQFLTHDPGENRDGEPDWLPDDEPARVPLDSWGRGSVPSRITESVKEEVEMEVESGSKKIHPDSLEERSSEEEASEQEDLDSIRRNPDLHKLNKLREQLKYYKINQDDITTLLKIEKPSDTLHLLYQSLGILQGQSAQSYEYEVAVTNLTKTVQFIETFGPQSVSESTMGQIKPYVDNIKLHPDHVTALASPASKGLCLWLHKVYTYQTMCSVLNFDTTLDLTVMKACLIEMKSFSNPPQLVKTVITAFVALMEGKFITNYQTIVKYLGSIEKILERIESFDHTVLTQKFINRFKKEFSTMDADKMKAVSASTAYVWQWIEHQIYGSGSIIVKPPEVKKKKTRRVIKIQKQPQSPVRDTMNSQVVESYSLAGSQDNMLPHQSAAIVKAQQGRPPGQKEVEYDDKGNVVSVLKIKKLPTHRVRTTFEIVDTIPMTGTKGPRKLKPIKGTSNSIKRGVSGLPYDSQDHTPIPPSFVDAVTASPGVVIKQGTRVKRGPESVILSPIDGHTNNRLHNLLSS